MYFYKRVAGVSFYQDAVGRCRVGDVVELVAEPDNVHDPHAIMVLREMELEKIGYIPRDETQAIHSLLRSNRVTTAVIDKMELYPMNDGREITIVKIRVGYREATEDDGKESVLFSTPLTQNPTLIEAMGEAANEPTGILSRLLGRRWGRRS